MAYEQALDYFPGIETHELPQYVLVSDFFEFRLTNLDTREEHRFTLSELSEKTHLFGFISGYTLHWMKLRFGYSPYVYPIPVERDVMIGLKSAI